MVEIKTIMNHIEYISRIFKRNLDNKILIFFGIIIVALVGLKTYQSLSYKVRL